MELGLKLFPVTPRKRPAMIGWQRYAIEAKIDDIRNQWRLGYRAFGIYLAPSRLVVLDADTPEANAWSEENLPHTPMATVTKRGMHRFYRLPEGAMAPKDNRPLAGIALDRKAKGYVIAPGSLIGGFVYRETSYWDTELSGLPLYPASVFPKESAFEPCKLRIIDMPFNKDASVIAKWFIKNSEDSEQGCNGSRVMKRAASFFVNGLALNGDDAMACLSEWNTHRAKPMWSDRELQHAIITSSAEGASNGRPRGWAYVEWAKQ